LERIGLHGAGRGAEGEKGGGDGIVDLEAAGGI
jgi:hypothetical protein